MNKENYFRARSYAFKCDPNNYKDILHNAYLKWYDKTGKDLFDEPDHTRTAVLRWMVKGKYKGRFYTNGVLHPRVFVPIGEEIDDSMLTHIAVSDGETDTILIDQDLNEEFEKLLTENEKLIKKKLMEGYSYTETLHRQGESAAVTSYYVVKTRAVMKEKLREFLSEQY